MAQIWNDTSLPWQNLSLPYKNTAMPWNDPSLPWKADGGGGIVLSAAFIAQAAANSDPVGTASISGTHTGSPNFVLTDASNTFALTTAGALTVSSNTALATNGSFPITITDTGSTSPAPAPLVTTIWVVATAPVLALVGSSPINNANPTFTFTATLYMNDLVRVFDSSFQLGTDHTVTLDEALSGNVAMGLAALSETTHTITAEVGRGGYFSAASSGVPVTVDTVVPNLSVATAVKVNDVSANLSVVTDTAAGTMWWFISQSATPPASVAVLKAGAGADVYGNGAVGSSPYTHTATGLVGAHTYYAYYYQEDAAGNGTPITAAAASFTTDATTGGYTQTYSNEQNGSGNATFTFTSVPVTAGNVVVCVGTNTGQPDPTSVTVNGVAATKLAGTTNSGDTIWELSVATGGSYSVVVTGAYYNCQIIVGTIITDAAFQQVYSTAGQSSTTQTLSAVIPAGGYAIGSVTAIEGNAPAFTTGTSDHAASVAGISHGVAHRSGVSGSQAIAWNFSGDTPTAGSHMITWPGSSSYVGITDVWKPYGYSNANDSCWSFFAASNRALTSAVNCCDIYDTTTTTTQTFGFNTNGVLDHAAIATFLGGHTGRVTKVYDQSPAGNHLIETTAGSGPLYFYDGVTYPCMRFNNGVQSLKTTSVANIVQPWSMFAFLNRASGHDSLGQSVMTDSNSNPSQMVLGVPQNIGIYAPSSGISSATNSAVDGVWTDVFIMLNYALVGGGDQCDLFANGTLSNSSSSISFGTGIALNATMIVGFDTALSQTMYADVAALAVLYANTGILTSAVSRVHTVLTGLSGK